MEALWLPLLCTRGLASKHTGGCQHDVCGMQATDQYTEKAMLAYYFKKQEEQKVSAHLQFKLCLNASTSAEIFAHVSLKLEF